MNSSIRRVSTIVAVFMISGTFILFMEYTKKKTREDIAMGAKEVSEKGHNLENYGQSKTDHEWEEFISTISSGLSSCHQLLPNFEIPTDFSYKWEKFLRKIEKQTQETKEYEGNIEKYRGQRKLYYYLSSRTFIKTVCEIGFNFGHSAFIWLSASQSTMLYSFDIGKHGYTKDMAAYLKHNFQDRFHILYGDSSVTVPALLDQNPWLKCDVLVVDGGHTYTEAKNDLVNMYNLARKRRNIVIFDDYPRKDSKFSRELGKAWQEVKTENKVKGIFSCLSQDGGHGFSVGQYLNF